VTPGIREGNSSRKKLQDFGGNHHEEKGSIGALPPKTIGVAKEGGSENVEKTSNGGINHKAAKR